VSPARFGRTPLPPGSSQGQLEDQDGWFAPNTNTRPSSSNRPDSQLSTGGLTNSPGWKKDAMKKFQGENPTLLSSAPIPRRVHPNNKQRTPYY